MEGISVNRIAVFFPGIGYHCDKPLLYFSRDIGYEQGYEKYINVQYSFKAENIRGNQEKMVQAFEALYGQAEEVLQDIDWNSYDDILFVSKSIGTIIATAYADRHKIEDVKQVLYTPLVQTFDFELQNAIAFIGTNDAWSDVNEIVRLAHEKQIPIEVYDNCNHSLECDDTLLNIEFLADIIRKTKDFILKVN